MSTQEPPQFIIRLLERTCQPRLVEGILGDLFEGFDDHMETKGLRTARLLFIWRALGFLRPRFRKKSNNSNYEAMLRNYLLSARRSLVKHPFYALLNTLGLAIGLACGFLILQYVHFELSYDSFFDNKENIYRVQTNRYNKGELTTQWAAGAAGAGRHMAEDFPEVLDYVILWNAADQVEYKNEFFELEYSYFAKENFFEVFSIPLIQGADSLVLDEPYTVVLSATTAKRLFGSENPVGEMLKGGRGLSYKVTGVFEDIPENSHMSFDILFSFQTVVAQIGDEEVQNWFWDGWLNYVVLSPGTDPKELESKFPDFVSAREGEELEEYDEGMNFELQPLDEIHLTSDYRMEIKANGDKNSTYFLLVIGLFVLVIAWINYINLTTARSLARAKEVGIRKALGSHKTQLIVQFLFESLFVNLIGLLLAAGLVAVALPFFNDFIGRSDAYLLPATPIFWIGWVAIVIFGILISGFYPSMVLSGFKPVVVLRGRFAGGTKGNLLRKGLVIVQFLATIVLITGTIIVYQQMDHLQSQDLGVKIEQTLIVETPRYDSDSTRNIHDRIFSNSLEAESAVSSIAFSTEVPGRSPGWNAGGIRLTTQPENAGDQYRIIGCNDRFSELYGLEIVSGRSFDESYGNEGSNVLVNQTAVPRLGLSDTEEALGKKIVFWGDTFNIVGVVKDYRQESPKQAYDALIFRYFSQGRGYYSIAVNTTQMAAAMDRISIAWEDAFGSRPFNYFFLDDHYNEQYQAELRFGTIFGLFSALAIVVACLGLFGLASFMTELRTKEIGVRKVLGASIQRLWVLLTSDFLKLVAIAIGISLPLTWWIMDGWLENFANRISLSWWLFALPAFGLIALAVVIVSYHTIRTTLLNPATTLKDE